MNTGRNPDCSVIHSKDTNTKLVFFLSVSQTQMTQADTLQLLAFNCKELLYCRMLHCIQIKVTVIGVI